MKLPLFPLHAVLCPGIALPLHIFEERYRELVRYCIDASMPFGIVLIRDGREVGGGSLSFSAIGTLAEIRQAGRYPDGRYDLLVVGTGRFAIEDVTVGEELYLIADATVLDDEVGDEDEARELANRATRRFVRYLELLQPQDGETAEELDIRVEVETEDAMPPGSMDDAPDRPMIGDPASERRVIIPDDPDDAVVLADGDHPGRAAEAPGTARGRYDRGPPAGPARADRPRDRSSSDGGSERSRRCRRALGRAAADRGPDRRLEVPKVGLGVVEEVACEADVLEVRVGDRSDRRLIERPDRGSRERLENW